MSSFGVWATAWTIGTAVYRAPSPQSPERGLSHMIDALDFPTSDIRQPGRLLEMRVRETTASASMATKLRLTQQSRIGPRTAGRRTDGHSGDPPPWTV